MLTLPTGCSIPETRSISAAETIVPITIRMGAFSGYAATTRDGWRVVVLGGNVDCKLSRYDEKTARRFDRAAFIGDPQGRFRSEWLCTRLVATRSLDAKLAEWLRSILDRFSPGITIDTNGSDLVELRPVENEEIGWSHLAQAFGAAYPDIPRYRQGDNFLFDAETQERGRLLEKASPWLRPALQNSASALEALTLRLDAVKPSVDAVSISRVLDLDDLPLLYIRNGNSTRVQWTAKVVECLNRHYRKEHEGREIAALANMLSLLPQSWVPQQQKDFEAAFAMASFTGRSWVLGYPDIQPLVAGASGGWARLLETLLPFSPTGDDFEGLLNAISDMVGHVARNLVAPAIPEGENRSLDLYSPDGQTNYIVARMMLTPDGSLGLLARKSRRWHEVQSRLPTFRRPAAATWAELSPPFIHRDLTLRFLTSKDELEEEGEQQRHCVKSMHQACVVGDTHIASIRRTLDGKRLSTVEITGDRRGVSVRQHRALKNSRPSPECEDALSAWKSAVEGRQHSISWPAPRKVGDESSELLVPEPEAPAQWKGILQSRLTAMTSMELLAEIRHINRTFDTSLNSPF